MNKSITLFFNMKLETIQYNAALAITCAIRGNLDGKLYEELTFEFLQLRPWHNKFCYSYKKNNEHSQNYAFRFIPNQNTSYAINEEPKRHPSL